MPLLLALVLETNALVVVGDLPLQFRFGRGRLRKTRFENIEGSYRDRINKEGGLEAHVQLGCGP